MKQIKLNSSFFYNIYSPVNNQNGSAMVISLMILVILTIMGISATNTSVIEIKIAGNEKVYRQNFNLAESAIMESIQVFENTTPDELKDPTKFSLLPWLKPDGTDMKDRNSWSNTGVYTFNANVRYAVVERGLASGTSLGMSGTSQLYEHNIFGFSESNNGVGLIQIGYRKRY